MYTLKRISREAIPAALERAMRYRLLNEPFEADSICRDILEIDPDNKQALISLILSLTDQFPTHLTEAYAEAMELVPRLKTDYEQAYYSGIICERRAHAHREKQTFQSGNLAYEWLTKAMQFYEQAEPLSTPDNNEAILRWNSCARAIMRFSDIKPNENTASPTVELE
jgi:hypothetical protein